MEKALAKLWDMYEEIKWARTNGNLESSFAIHNLTEEKKKLQENYDSLYVIRLRRIYFSKHFFPCFGL